MYNVSGFCIFQNPVADILYGSKQLFYGRSLVGSTLCKTLGTFSKLGRTGGNLSGSLLYIAESSTNLILHGNKCL